MRCCPSDTIPPAPVWGGGEREVPGMLGLRLVGEDRTHHPGGFRLPPDPPPANCRLRRSGGTFLDGEGRSGGA
eukprot:7291622-Alexandrium_andersonii.AAC.2